MDRKALLLAPAAIALGLAGGFAWSTLTPPPLRGPKPPKAAIVAPPPSPEEAPSIEDSDWASRAADRPVRESASAAPVPSVHYSGCNEVRAVGKAPLHRGDPGYREDMDGDLDGVACEPIRNR